MKLSELAEEVKNNPKKEETCDPCQVKVVRVGPHRDTVGDKIVSPTGNYHVVPVLDEWTGTIARRRLYDGGHLGAVED